MRSRTSYDDRLYISNRGYSQIHEMDDKFTDIQVESVLTNIGRTLIVGVPTTDKSEIALSQYVP